MDMYIGVSVTTAVYICHDVMPYVHPFIQVTTGIANVRVHPKCEGIAKWTTDQVSIYSFTKNMPDAF
jgi:hypothetical protein